MASTYQPVRGRGICGRWNDTCTCVSRVLEYTCYYSTISPTTYALPEPLRAPSPGPPTSVSAPHHAHVQGPAALTQSDLPGPAAATSSSSFSSGEAKMRYSSPSPSSSPDTHDYNNIPATSFYHSSLYQTSPAKLILTPTILPPTAPPAANKITKRSTEKKSTEMRSCAGPRCTRFKHSSSMSAGIREWDVDALGGTTGWFLQRLIEVATTGNELPTVPSGQMVRGREQKVGGMEVDADADVDRVREQLERLKTVDTGERKDVQVVKAQVHGEEVLAMAKTLESLTVSNQTIPPTTAAAAKSRTKTRPIATTPSSSTLSCLPSNPFSALPSSSSLPTIPPYAPLISTITTSTITTSTTNAHDSSAPSTPPPLSPSLTATPTSSPPQPIKNSLRAAAKPYYPSSPVLSARRYSPSNSSHSSYPGYKGLASSSGSGSGISRRMGVDRVDRGKDKERVYTGQYTWSGYSSDGSYDHAPPSPSSSLPSPSSYSPLLSYSSYSHSTLYSPSSPSLSSSSHAPFPSSSKVHAGRIGKRRAASSGAGGSSGLNLSVGALASLGQASAVSVGVGAGVMQMHMGMGVVVMGVRRVGRRAPSPEVKVAAAATAAVERKDPGFYDVGMIDGGRRMLGMHSGDNDGDVVMVMDGGMDMDGEWEL